MADNKPDEAPPAAAIGVVLKPGQIKATEEDAPPWWRFYAIIGGATVVALIVLGVIGLMGRKAPPQGPLLHPAPEVQVALDLDDLPAGTLEKPRPLPGAGVMPAEKGATKVAARGGGGRARKGGGGMGAPPKIEGPAEAPKKPSGAIIYQPSGPR
ncbi:MAG: hypothetical protein HY906_09330 [Deltaproteobacteria bacterium]|nr:hypothetical protein [Deltaproteobacteria bacterium]